MEPLKGLLNRRWIKIIGTAGVFLLFLQVSFYYSADFFLRNYIQEKVKIASQNKYEINFERFHISIFQRGFSFKNLYLIPKEDNLIKANQPYYKVYVPEIMFKRLFYLFQKKEIQIGELLVKTPSVDFFMPHSSADAKGISTLKILEEQIQKSFLQSTVSEIRIKKLKVEEADLLLKNFVSQRAISAEHTNIYLEDIQLLGQRNPKTPFNALGFRVDLENFQLLLADSVHTIKAGEVVVSSLDQMISAKKVALVPNFQKYASNYLGIQLEELMLSEADINKVFETAKVDVGNLRINRPIIQLEGQRKKDNSLMEIFDFYALIDGILKEINIDNLQIQDGQFQEKLLTDNFNRISAEQINFDLMGIYIGPDASKKQNQFFYAKDAILDLKNVEVSLGQGSHFLKAEQVHLSSIDDEVHVQNVKVAPKSAVIDPQKTQYTISIPALSIQQAQLKKVYQEGILDVANLLIERPNVLIQNLQESEKNISSSQLKNLANEYLTGVYIQQLDLKEGTFVMDNNLQWKQDSLSFGKINLSLENFSLDDHTQNLPTFFLAKNVRLELQDYALKLADNLHIFKAKNFLVDTKNASLEIQGFSLAPVKTQKIQSLLDQYNKTSNIDVFIPVFKAYGIDYNKAILESKLHIDRIHIPAPKISFVQHLNIKNVEDNEGKQGDALELLKFYFSEILVQSLKLEKGSLSYENYTKDRLRTFAEDNITIDIRGFKIDENSKKEDVGNLFSEEVNLLLNNYVFNLADGKYNILADQVIFNSSKEEILTKNVRINPNTQATGQVGFTALIPSLSLKGIDLESFLLDNTLQLNRLLLNDATIHVLVDKDLVVKAQKVSKKSNIKLPKTIDFIKIDTIETLNSQFYLNFKQNKKQNELINSKINLKIYDFNLDSVKIKNQNLNQIFTALNLSIDDFWLTLPDSLHKITFTKIALDTRYEGILLNNLRIIPENLSGKPGIPVFSGYIPTALIKIASLSDVGKLESITVNDIQFYRPEIEIFTDNVKPTERKPVTLQELPDILKNSVLHRFEIVEGNLSLIDKNWQKKPQHFYEVNLSVTDVNMNFESLFSLKREGLWEKNFNINLPNLSFYSKDSLYRYQVGWVNFENNKIQAKDLKISPVMGVYATNRMLGIQTDIPDIGIEDILVHHPNYEQYFQEETLRAQKVEVQGIHATLFRDKRFTLPIGRTKPMPQVLMKSFDYPLILDSLLVKNSQLTYVEFPKKGFVPGKLTFEQMSFEFFPWKMGTALQGKDPLVFDARWRLNGQAPFEVRGILNAEEPYQLKVHAEVDAFELSAVNSILETNVLAKVNQGKVEKGTFDIIANNEVATGKMTLLYNDLELQLLDGQTLERGRGRKSILTFVINNLALKKQNPRKWKKQPHESAIYYRRDESRFIFNYLWNATLTGIRETLGMKNKAQEIRKKPETKRN
jgi:hypothetical protein